MANYYKRLNPSDTEVELDVDEPTTIRWGRMVTSCFEPQHPYGAARTFGEKSKGDMKVESLRNMDGGLVLRTRETSVGPWEMEKTWSELLSWRSLLFRKDREKAWVGLF